ncbi:hypothetical protein F900_00006 [Acinetobacter modestus]|uniref:Uncharacterized protein n=2 Tax=Acinetobacter modestus TaxID=1776740 RepID=N9M7V5_9GAMM|nr:hypothetical protein [Acinetobacter modestus]ENX04593.1 hypothetical protein F900_00006 [Acinetobacter modestus]
MTIAIPEFRQQTCLALISAGTTQSDQIINTVAALEKFVFSIGDTQPSATPDIKNAKAETTAKTTKTAEKTEEVKAEVTAKEETAVEEIQTSIPNFTKDEVHKALVGVAQKHGRAALVTLLGEVNAEKLTDVAESDYPKLMKLVEEYPV